MLNALLQSGVDPANGFTVDHVEGTKISGSTFDDSGRRHGSVELLNKAKPGNLKVVVHATVDRVIFSTSKSLGNNSSLDSTLHIDSMSTLSFFVSYIFDSFEFVHCFQE